MKTTFDPGEFAGQEHEWIVASIGFKRLTACWYYEPAQIRFILRAYDETSYFNTLEEGLEAFNKC